MVNFCNLIAAILEKTNFGVIIIRAGLFQVERNKIITDFTDSNFFFDVCVLNINISNTGFNLHYNYYIGIIIPLIWNVNI